ncbi:AAA family ATPase [Paenibacillus donghaensis]|uniref:ATP-binding protein n=1 Tax=Paenibacillus donghaensis TaxID=414771 RepID=UPI001883E620|nr:ATP-binding protein [Paenibacillus donghaensis]MBE9917121.1 AAA family ATPase [Paenibacillus donghaensis]
MECVIFIGIQGSGKSTFYKEHFFKTHMRINLDMLRTRNREDIYLAASIKAMQRFVVDNTNPTIHDRRKYIEIAKKYKFKIVGYYFEPDYDLSFSRNEMRQGKEKVSEVAIKSTLKKLQKPTYAEGFDELYTVKSADGEFLIEKME